MTDNPTTQNLSTLHRDEALDHVAAVLAYADASEESGSALGAQLAQVEATLHVGEQLRALTALTSDIASALDKIAAEAKTNGRVNRTRAFR